MTATLPDPRPPADREPLIEPGRRLSPSPRGDRPWRVLITLAGAAVLGLVLLLLIALSTASWLDGLRYSEVPATTELGVPDSLSLTSDVGDLRVVRTADVDQVTLALVEDGEITLPAADETVRASVRVRGGDAAPDVTVQQPSGPATVPWERTHRDLVLLIPEAHEMALTTRSDVGDVEVDGVFASLEVTADVGDVTLGSVEAPGGVAVTTSVGGAEIDLEGSELGPVEVTGGLGDVDLGLPEGATGTVTVRTDVGDIAVAVPGDQRWDAEASSDVGRTRVDPDLVRDGGADPQHASELTARSDLGDVTVTR